MTTLNKTQDKKLNHLIQAQETKGKIKGYLLMEGFEEKEVNAILKEKGLLGRKTFRTLLYTALEVGELTEEAFGNMIEADGSSNVLKHRAHYNEIRVLINKVHASK